MNGTAEAMTSFQLPWSALSMGQLEAEMSYLNEPKFRARQIYRSLHANNLTVWEHATDLPSKLRSKLALRRDLRSLTIAEARTSRLDGSTKLLMQATDGGLIEGVLMKSATGASARITACVSSQIGCPAACTFCASGINGFTRNLTTTEITDQVAVLANYAQDGKRIDNLVFMGMGEPFLNYARVMEANVRLRDPAKAGIGSRRITVSTVGIVPGILRFAED